MKITDKGRVLIGGSPTRVLYLSELASKAISDRTVTVSTPASRLLADRLLEAGMADPLLDRLPDADVKTVTIVVPVYGRARELDRLLASLLRKYRVIVVDDCSPNPSEIREVTERHQTELVRLETNGGPARARNVGLSRVNTPLVAFADSDIVVDEDAIPILIKHFYDPRVALVGPRVEGLGDLREMNWIGRYEEARSSLDLGVHPAVVRPRSPVSWLPGACLVARVDALVGGFDERRRVGEDVDLVWRLSERGWRIRFDPTARVQHEHRQSLNDWLKRKMFYGSSAHDLSINHPRAIAPAVFAPWSTVAVCALLMQRPWSVFIASAATTVATLNIAKKLSRNEHPLRDAAALTVKGLLSAHSQTIALLVRHWWPLAAIGCLVSRKMRRAVLLSAVIDAGLEYRRTRPRLDPLRFALARRLDDLAYGSGVWLSAWRGRSVRCLLPEIHKS